MMTWTRRELLAGAGSLAMAVSLPATASAAVRMIGGPAFGTSWRVALPQDADGATAKAAMESIISAIDAAMSPYRDSSELSRFNGSATTGWFPLSADCAAVAAEGLRIAALTGGAFDPTVGGIVGRYGFGPIAEGAPATHADLAIRRGAVRKTKPGVTFDPCGIGKGYALDRMAAKLARLGIGAFMIELGGEVFARGDHPAGRPWQIGIERPGAGGLSLQRILRLNGEALATSGDTVNGYDVAGRRYSHIIDPRTARPVAGPLAAVSVIAPSGMTADALATALFVMGAQAGSAFARRQGLAALFLVRDGNDLSEIRTPRLAAYILA